MEFPPEKIRYLMLNFRKKRLRQKHFDLNLVYFIFIDYTLNLISV